MKAQQNRAPGRELYQIEGRWAVTIKAAGGDLNIAAIIPNLINSPSVSPETLASGAVFDPVAVGENHVLNIRISQ